MKKRALKVFIFFAAVALLTSAASYFFISGYLYPLIITSTKKVINEFTGGETEIGRLSLSLFPPGIEMSEILITIDDRKKAFFRVKKIRAELDPVQAFSGTIHINRITVSEPRLDAFTDVLPQKKPGDDKLKDKLQPEFFKVNIREITIKKGHFILRHSDNDYVEVKETFLTAARSGADGYSFALHSEEGKIVFKGKEESLNNLNVKGESDEETIRISDLSFSTSRGKLAGSAIIGIKPSIFAKGSIKGQVPLDWLSSYVNKDLPLKKEGEITTVFSYEAGKADLEASLDYQQEGQPLKLKAILLILDNEIKIRQGEIDADRLKADVSGSIFPGNRIDLDTKLIVPEVSGLLAPFMKRVPSGRLTAAGKIKGTLSSPQIKADIEMLNAAWTNYRAETVSGTLSYSEGRFLANAVKISRGEAMILAEGQLVLAGKESPEGNLKIEIPPCRISDLLAMMEKTFPIEGQITSRINVNGKIDKLKARVEASIEEGEFYGEKAERVQLTGEYFNETFTVEEFLLRHGQATLTAKGTIPLKEKIDIDLNAKNVDLAEISHLNKKVSGNVNLEGKIEGKLSAPVIKGVLWANKVRSEKADLYANLEGRINAKINTAAPYRSLLTYRSDSLRIYLKSEKEISLSPFTLNFKDKMLSFSRTTFTDRYGSVSLTGTLSVEGEADISVKAVTSLDGLETLLKGVENMDGHVEANAEIKGYLTDPLIKGSIHAQKGIIRFKGFPYDMTGIDGKLSLSGNRVTLDKVSGKLENANFSGGGYLVLDGFSPSEIRLFFDIEEVELSFPRWLPSRSKGRITITAMDREVTLGGDIEILRASYTDEVEFKSFLSKIISFTDRKIIEEERNKKVEEGDLNVRIRFRADDNLVIRNNLADLELKGDLLLMGKGHNLSLMGNLETLGGKGYFREREFIIRKGTVDFTDRERIIPIVNIDAETTIKDYLVEVNISGPPKNLVVTLNSDPPLEEREIVSLITFGYTADELRGRDTQITSLGAASLILQEDIEAKMKQYFGFDRFRIESYYSETAETTETRLTVDKDLGDDTTASYSRGLSTLDEEVTVEYRLDDNLSLEGSWASTEDTVGAFGGDVILRYEFE